MSTKMRAVSANGQPQLSVVINTSAQAKPTNPNIYLGSKARWLYGVSLPIAAVLGAVTMSSPAIAQVGSPGAGPTGGAGGGLSGRGGDQNQPGLGANYPVAPNGGGAGAVGFINAGGGGAESGGGGGFSGTGTGGGGGGGGGSGAFFTSADISTSGNVIGSAGGAGAGGVGNAAGGGGGGGGGNGIVVTSTLGSLSIDHFVFGGAGGAGGNTTNSNASGGDGGTGGNGLVLQTGPLTINVNSAIAGGMGGAPGTGASNDPGTVGAGGIGIVGSDLTISMGLAGTIAGGLSGGGGSRANAISFTGGTNAINFVTAASGLTGGIGIAAGASAELNAAPGGTTIDGNSVISGAGSVILNSANILTLSGANTYSGGTTLSSGTVHLGNSSALGTGTLTTANGTIVRAVANMVSTNSVLLGAGTTTFDTNGYSWTSGSFSGIGSLAKAGGGFLVLSGTNTYSGNTTVIAGTLAAGGANVFNANSAHTLQNSAALDLGGYNQTIGSLAGSAGTTVTSNVPGSVTLTTGGDNTSTTFGGVIENGASTLALTKAGTGTFTLTGFNTYAGGTAINAGAINAQNAGALGSGGVTVSAGAALQLQGGIAVNNGMTISGSGVANDGALRNISGSNVVNGGFNLNSSSRINSDAGLLTINGGFAGVGTDLTFGGAGNIALNGGINILSNGALNKDGTGTLTLSAGNSYTAGTNINAGVVNAQNGLALGTGAAVVANGAALQLQTGITLGNAITLNGMGVNNDGALRSSQFSNTVTGAITLGSDTRINSDTDTLTLSGGITGTGQNLTIGGNGGTSITGPINNATGSLTADGNLFLLGTGNFSSLTVNGQGTVLFNGSAVADTASVVVNAPGLLTIFDSEAIGSLSGSGTLAFNPGAVLTTGGNNASTTFSGNIGQFGADGSLVKEGSGTFTLTGANTYTGTTTINAGAINIQNANALGTTAGGTTVAAGAALQLQTNFTTGEALTLNGTGIANDGALRSVSGNNGVTGVITLGSATRINTDGAGMVLSGGITGAGQNVTFGGAGLTTVSGNIATGTGTLTKDGAGNLALQGINTYTGVTTVNAGTLFLIGGAAIADTGAIVVNAPGSLTVAAGPETIGSLAGSGNVALNNNSTTLITGNNNTSTTMSGVVSGLGSLTKAGTGTFTLSGMNTYTGATTVNAGTLAVNGSIATSSMTTVNAGATLGGTGTVGNTTIAAGGFLAPGNSIGTLNVQGNLVLNAASTYMIEVNPTSADRTNVTGTANLGGAGVNANFAPGSYVARQYTVLNATGGLGGSTFGAQVNTNLPSGFNSSLSYDANNAYLNLALNFVPPPPGPNAPVFTPLTGNQTNVANALVNSFNTAGGIPLVFGALTPQGLTQVSGEAATGSQQTTFNAMGQFLGVLTDPFMGTRTGGAGSAGASAYADESEALAYAQSRKRNPNDALAAIHTKAPVRPTLIERLWSVWGAGYGGTQSTGGNAVVGSNDTRSRVYGAAAGVDYRLTPNTIVGFSLGGAGTNFSVANALGTGRSEMFQAGVYGRHTAGAAYISGALAYGWQDVTTDRNVFGNAYRANFNADSLSARIEGGWRFATSATSGLTPYAAGQVTSFWLPQYAEQTIGGVNTFALAYNAKDVTASRSELGLRGDTSFAMQEAVLTLRGRAAWAHNFDTDRSINAIFQTLPASGFTVNGAMQARDAALLSAGGEIRWASGFSIAGTFEGEFSRNVDSYAGKGVVRYQW